MGNRVFWRKGGAEIIGFLCTLPSLLFFLMIIITVMQHGTIKERLEFTAYKACRAAIVCDNYEEAVTAAKETATNDLLMSSEKFDSDSISVELFYTDGTEEDSKEFDKKWKKGEYITCSVSVDIKTPSAILDNRRNSTIVMMIEMPANENGNYPWFS